MSVKLYSDYKQNQFFPQSDHCDPGDFQTAKACRHQLIHVYSQSNNKNLESVVI